MKGLFVNFYNPYKGRSFQEQAKTIVDLADQYLEKFPKVGIIYSANYGQAQKIKKRYSKGNWLTDIGGANQGAVMTAFPSTIATGKPHSLL